MSTVHGRGGNLTAALSIMLGLDARGEAVAPRRRIFKAAQTQEQIRRNMTFAIAKRQAKMQRRRSEWANAVRSQPSDLAKFHNYECTVGRVYAE